MNWDAIGAIAELLGVLAVLATIIYLAVQVRGARDELRHSIEQNVESTNMTLMLEHVRNTQLAAAINKALAATGRQDNAGREALRTLGEFSEEELSTLHNFYYSWWLSYSTAIGNVSYLSPDRQAVLNRRLRYHYGSGPQKVWFDGYRKGKRDDPAIGYVDKVLSEDT
jgi:hypothetical protein